MLLLSTISAHAEIYVFVDEAGVSHYSNIPTDKRYVLVLESTLDVESMNPLQVKPVQSTPTTQNTSPQASLLPDQKESTLANEDLPTEQLLAHIEQAASHHQLNSALIQAVMQVESGLQVKAKSPKGAVGLMQLMPATARRFGVKDIDNAHENIEGGAKYLRYLLDLFNNDLSLALAAYNAGEQAVMKYGRQVPPYQETQAYVPKVIKAYKKLLNQQKPVQTLTM